MKPKPFSISDHRAPAPIIIKEGGGQPQGKSSNTGLYFSIGFIVVSNLAWMIIWYNYSKRTTGIIRGLEADVIKLKPIAAASQTQKQENQISPSIKTNENENQSATAATANDNSDSNKTTA